MAKSTGSELYDFLQSQGSDGKLDSEGSFTLLHDDAWSKLTEFQLSVEEGWVLKLVQAVTVLGKGGMWVGQVPTETTFRVSSSEHWTRDAVESRIFELDIRGGDDVGHLSLAIRALVQMKVRPFLVNYGDGQRVGWNGHKFLLISDQGPCEFHLKVGHYGIAKWGQNARFKAEEGARAYANIAGALRQHCHLSPADIYFGGESIRPGVNDQDMGTPSRGQPLGIIAVRPGDDIKLPMFRISNPFKGIRAELGSHTLSLGQLWLEDYHKGSANPAYVLTSVFAGSPSNLMPRSSRLFWINDGVIAHREHLDVPASPVALAILVSSKGLLTDLSGMVPRMTPEYLARRQQAIEAAHHQLAALLNYDKQGPINIQSRHAPKIGGGAFTAFSFYLDPTFGLATLTVFGGYLAINRYARKKQSGLNPYFRAVVEALGLLSATTAESAE